MIEKKEARQKIQEMRARCSGLFVINWKKDHSLRRKINSN